MIPVQRITRQPRTSNESISDISAEGESFAALGSELHYGIGSSGP
jgi:hypothetical protein